MPPIPGIVSAGLIVSIFIHEYIIFHHIHPLHPFFISSPSHWYQTPHRICFTFLFSILEGEKKKTFLFKIVIQAGRPWLIPIILATQEVEIRRITVQSQPRQIVPETLFQKYPSQKKGRWSGSR
jgi:hypothetical protein